ncbi:50S ribosomal protein L29 [Candidatus Nomurabacteria bacterium]|nr:50S ribosomal protein L29 [Candidatus Nomurabacteria bacterium]
MAKTNNNNWQEKVIEQKENLRQVRFGGSMGKSKDVKVAKKTRHEIARLLTAANATK